MEWVKEKIQLQSPTFNPQATQFPARRHTWRPDLER